MLCTEKYVVHTDQQEISNQLFTPIPVFANRKLISSASNTLLVAILVKCTQAKITFVQFIKILLKRRNNRRLKNNDKYIYIYFLRINPWQATVSLLNRYSDAICFWFYLYKPETGSNLISWKIKFFRIREMDELAARYRQRGWNWNVPMSTRENDIKFPALHALKFSTGRFRKAEIRWWYFEKFPLSIHRFYFQIT